jgi:hypothetical protein
LTFSTKFQDELVKDILEEEDNKFIMKIRQSFVSNSSSCNFIALRVKIPIIELRRVFNDQSTPYWKLISDMIGQMEKEFGLDTASKLDTWDGCNDDVNLAYMFKKTGQHDFITSTETISMQEFKRGLEVLNFVLDTYGFDRTNLSSMRLKIGEEMF